MVSLAVLLMPLPAASHALAPALLLLQERQAGNWEVTWKVPSLRPVGESLRPLLPAWCVAAGEAEATRDADALRLTWSVACGERGLEGATVGVDGLERSRTAALLRVLFADGSQSRWLLTAAAARRQLARAETDSPASQALRFAVLGAEHLLTGADHLAFLLGLFLLVRGRRALLAAVSAFTVGHSITLSLAVLGWFPIAPPVVEVGIASSIVLVAAEVAEGRAGVLTRRPWAAALGFGLLHGAGFASALRLAGVPHEDLPLALAAFNAGIEAGQILFLGAILVVVGGMRRLTAADLAALRRPPAYALGALAAFWVLDRLSVLL